MKMNIYWVTGWLDDRLIRLVRRTRPERGQDRFGLSLNSSLVRKASKTIKEINEFLLTWQRIIRSKLLKSFCVSWILFLFHFQIFLCLLQHPCHSLSSPQPTISLPKSSTPHLLILVELQTFSNEEILLPEQKLLFPYTVLHF